MKICVLSYKRADEVITGRYLPAATIVVPESQEVEYRQYNKNPIVACPDAEDGNISKKRNWTIKHFKDKEDIVLMDDDIRQIGYNEDGTGSFRISPKRFEEFCLIAFNMCRELGTPLWGLNQNFDPLNYKSYSPFSFTSCVLGPVMGICKENDFLFDEDIYLKEDYDFSLQVLLKYRKILRFNKYHYVSKHIFNKGGLVGTRSKELEKEHALRLQQKWGNKVVTIFRTTAYGNETINPKVAVPIKGI